MTIFDLKNGKEKIEKKINREMSNIPTFAWNEEL